MQHSDLSTSVSALEHFFFFINTQAYFISRANVLADTRSMKDKTYDKNDIDFKGFSS